MLAPIFFALVCAAGEPGEARTASTADIPEYEDGAHALDLKIEDDTLPPCSPRTEEIYEDGFARLATDDRIGALRRFNEVLEECPEHPYARELRRLAELATPVEALRAADILRSNKAAAPRRMRARHGMGVETTIDRGERPTLLTRAELVALQGTSGLVQGVLLCSTSGCNNETAYVAAAALGFGVAGGLTLAVSEDVLPGQALAINAGTAWAYWFTIAATRAARPPDEASIEGYTIALPLAGTGVGIAIAALAKPSEGSVSLADSGGIWAGVLAAWTMSAAGLQLFDQRFYGVELAATGGGLALGALATRFFTVSRGHMLIIDAGGVAGMLTAIGAAFLIDTEPSQELVGGLALMGTAAGLGAATYFSRRFDERRSMSFALAPMPRGLAMTVSF